MIWLDPVKHKLASVVGGQRFTDAVGSLLSVKQWKSGPEVQVNQPTLNACTGSGATYHEARPH
jgi:hypothetical protein